MSHVTFPALEALPSLPQIDTLRQIVSTLWSRKEVVALWLGGSFARGEADEYSDLDLRVAIATETLPIFDTTNLSALLGMPIAGNQRHSWAAAEWHHILLANGIILDFVIQDIKNELPQDYTLVIACRDEALAERLAATRLPEPTEPSPASPETIRETIVGFWINSSKHAKVLHRNLDMIALAGLGLEQSLLMRLWYIEATGHDQADQKITIHTLTKNARAIDTTMGTRALEILGAPRVNRTDILRAIEIHRDEVVRVGRRLADKFGFEYPEVLEQTARKSNKLSELS